MSASPPAIIHVFRGECGAGRVAGRRGVSADSSLDETSTLRVDPFVAIGIVISAAADWSACANSRVVA
jgi:hypothetical protein